MVAVLGAKSTEAATCVGIHNDQNVMSLICIYYGDDGGGRFVRSHDIFRCAL